MSQHSFKARKPTPELRMFWYPHLPAGTLSPEVIDEALRQGRQERAEMMAALLSRSGTLIKRGFSTLFRGFVIGQERRAEAALAQVRAMTPAAVQDYQAAARGELPGPVCEILSHPESHQGDTDVPGHPGDTPRLAA